MKTHNLMSFIKIFSLEDEDLKRDFIGEQYKKGNFIDDDEIEDIKLLIQNISDDRIDYYQGFFIGYKIPNIGKEFDLLKVTEDSILNIEVKSSSTYEEIHEQQMKNLHYLESIDKDRVIITYISSEESFYILDKNNETKSISRERVIEYFNIFSLKNYLNEIDFLFKPSEFLISPFNNTDKFLDSQYFLTMKQLKIKNLFLRDKFDLTIIEGSAGTGKSLLLYDIAKRLINDDKKILLLHCGYLNQGHTLMSLRGWNIKSPHDNWIWNDKYLEGLEYIFIDEAHRFRPNQLERITSYSLENDIKIVTTIDPKQYLHSKELYYDNLTSLKKMTKNMYYENLKDKIRSNFEISEFIKSLFNLRYNAYINFPSISLEYFNGIDDIKGYISSIEKRGWIFIPFTKSRDDISYHKYSEMKEDLNSHRVIGQEFDKVVVILDRSFIYEDGNLNYEGSHHFQPRQMLFQNLTRAKRNLKIVVVDNLPLYKNILQIVNGDMNFKTVNYDFNIPRGERRNAKKFYEGILGFETIINQGFPDQPGYIWFKVGQGQIRLNEKDECLPVPDGVFPTIHVPDLEKIEKDFQKNDIDIINRESKKDVKSFQFEDPFGNKITFMEKL